MIATDCTCHLTPFDVCDFCKLVDSFDDGGRDTMYAEVDSFSEFEEEYEVFLADYADEDSLENLGLVGGFRPSV